MHSNQRIVVYAGEGASPILGLGKLLDTREFLQTDWEQACDLFIMPGGRDRPYHAALQGAGNRKLRKFVENGGTYLGICAGAYYGAATVCFDEGCPLEVCEERELQFFPGTAVGPAYGKRTFDYTNNSGVRAARIATIQGTFHAYYNGGCTFEGDLSDHSILARYLDLLKHPPAIIACPVGKGKAILSGVHLEISAQSLDPTDRFLSPLIPLFAASETMRRFFWDLLLKLPHDSKTSAAEQMKVEMENHLASARTVVRQ